ncbi:ATP-binding protein [Microbacterium lacticum]|uniref:ATP-binding protein n=1 Tax=Microbacterium lacticum TaxID=33885 RepID=UPI001142EAD0|nr:sensor histidine kinase [Microbacterium lacticum]
MRGRCSARRSSRSCPPRRPATSHSPCGRGRRRRSTPTRSVCDRCSTTSSTTPSKYTPRAGSVAVALDVEGPDEAGRRDVTITVRDSGIGIAPGDLPRIFDDYFRAETARDAGLPGTGLGLGISRRIVEQHGGTLTLTSEPGAGTVATVRLPLALDADDEPGPGPVPEGD